MGVDKREARSPKFRHARSASFRRTRRVRQLEPQKCALIERVAELLNISKPDARKSIVAVLHAVRDQLPRHILVPFGEQLPPAVRPLYFANWESSNVSIATPLRAFVEEIQSNLPRVNAADPFSAINAVLSAVREHIGTTQMEIVKQTFAAEMHGLFETLPADVRPRHR